MLPPIVPFDGLVARFDSENFIHKENFPAFKGPSATVALWVRWIQLPNTPRPGAPDPLTAVIFNYGEEPNSAGSIRRLMLENMRNLRVNWMNDSITTSHSLDDGAW